MTKKELFVRIKKEADAIEISDLSQNIKNKIKPNPSIKKEKRRIKWPYQLGTAFACLILIFVGVLFFNKEKPITSYAEVSKQHQTFGLQAVTLFNFVDNKDVKLLSKNNSSLFVKKLTTNQDHYSEIADEINLYLFSAIDIFEKNNVEYKEEESDNPHYQLKMTMNVRTLDNIQQYILYFNETADVEYDDIDEVSSRIEGIIQMGSETFIFDGKKEMEEDEQEIELKMYLSSDKKDYYVVSQEIEKSENEFSYAYFLNGEEVEEVEISVEEKRFGKTIELEVVKGSKEVELEMHYHKNYIKVNYEINKLEGIVNVYPGIDTTLYKFGDIEITKNNK